MSQTTPQASSQQGQGSNISSTLSSVAQSAQSILMSFRPVSSFSEHLMSMPIYSNWRSRTVPAHHLVAPSPAAGVKQAALYDSDKPDAKLIGVEYIISEEVFQSLDHGERALWHSHKAEVEDGYMQLKTAGGVPEVAKDMAEKEPMQRLQKSYGKAIMTWTADMHPDLPLGPPALMTAYTASDQYSPQTLCAFEKAVGAEGCVQDKKEERSKYLDQSYKVKEGADGHEHGRGIEFKVQEADVKKGQVEWKGEMA